MYTYLQYMGIDQLCVAVHTLHYEALYYMEACDKQDTLQLQV